MNVKNIIWLGITPLAWVWRNYGPWRTMPPTPVEVFDSMNERRRGWWDSVESMEQSREALYAAGKASKIVTEKRRIKDQIVQIDKDIRRANQQIVILNDKISLHNAHCGNETIEAEIGRDDLPSAERLTSASVGAEQLIESLQERADLASVIDVGARQEIESDADIDAFFADPVETFPVVELTDLEVVKQSGTVMAGGTAPASDQERGVQAVPGISDAMQRLREGNAERA